MGSFFFLALGLGWRAHSGSSASVCCSNAVHKKRSAGIVEIGRQQAVSRPRLLPPSLESQKDIDNTVSKHRSLPLRVVADILPLDTGSVRKRGQRNLTMSIKALAGRRPTPLSAVSTSCSSNPLGRPGVILDPRMFAGPERRAPGRTQSRDLKTEVLMKTIMNEA